MEGSRPREREGKRKKRKGEWREEKSGEWRGGKTGGRRQRGNLPFKSSLGPESQESPAPQRSLLFTAPKAGAQTCARPGPISTARPHLDLERGKDKNQRRTPRTRPEERSAGAGSQSGDGGYGGWDSSSPQEAARPGCAARLVAAAEVPAGGGARSRLLPNPGCLLLSPPPPSLPRPSPSRARTGTRRAPRPPPAPRSWEARKVRREGGCWGSHRQPPAQDRSLCLPHASLGR